MSNELDPNDAANKRIARHIERTVRELLNDKSREIGIELGVDAEVTYETYRVLFCPSPEETIRFSYSAYHVSPTEAARLAAKRIARLV
jgi:hypothetical protein